MNIFSVKKSVTNVTPIKKAVISSCIMISSLPAVADVIISEYVEGSSFNKAIELYNSGSVSENLSDYQLIKYQNGDNTNLDVITLDSVTLNPGETYVIAHTSADETILAVASQTTGSLNFNGDDPVALVKSSDSSIVDFFGLYGDVNFGKDVTYARADLTLINETSWDASTWIQLDKDVFTGLGVAPGGVIIDPVSFSCNAETFTPIYSIQGNGTASPLIPAGVFVSDTIFTSGVITSITSSLYDGFFIQDKNGDGDASTSDGIFVYSTNVSSTLSIGDEVCVSGTVTEYFGSTQVSMASNAYEVLSTGNTIEATSLALSDDELLHDQLEAYEGMLVTTNDSDLIVSRAFSFDFDSFRNNMTMTHKEPIYKSTHVFVAETEEEQALVASNAKSTLFIETDEAPDDGVIPYFSSFNAENGYIRVGDKIANLEGVMGYSFGEYRLVVSDNIDLTNSDFDHTANDRTLNGPELSQIGNLRVASFNVLNLFNSPYGGPSNPSGSNRGAESQTEFDLQLSKITQAITLMDADIIGLMEIENNGFETNSAIAVLVDSINTTQPASSLPYSYVSAGDFVGSDAIAVGIIYRADVVTPINDASKIDLPEQHGTDINGSQLDKFQRVSLLQEFTHTESNENLSVVVNHFKSKGSACIEDSAKEDDVQGNCNAFRVSAAVVLGDYLENNTNGNVLVLGDLNSYGKEDPIRVLTTDESATSTRSIYTAEQTTLSGEVLDSSATEVTKTYGMVNLVEHFQGEKAYSYTFDGELGSLDHALANTSLLSSVVAVDDWHINAAESTAFQYSSENTGDLVKSNNAYSSSDHDPVIIEIDFKSKNTGGSWKDRWKAKWKAKLKARWDRFLSHFHH